MRTNLIAILATAFVVASAAPAFALNPKSGMPREPRTVAGMCAKANMGVHIPYRGWRSRDRLGFRTCMWPFWTAAHLRY
jgi:hypothetical protein